MEHGKNTLWPMIILMVVFSYVIMNNVMLTWRNGIYNHMNKAYMALLMGSLMGVIHYVIMIWNGHRSRSAWQGLVLWSIISIVFIILIRRQTFVDDKQFLKGMIEHHDMALQMSDQIKKRTNDVQIRNFANQIIRTQQGEINWMKRKLI